jgi:hypothetical protein
MDFGVSPVTAGLIFVPNSITRFHLCQTELHAFGGNAIAPLQRLQVYSGAE